MALGQVINPGTPLGQRGQGAVEAILALPVFLILICIIFQLFLLGIAQVHLQYAAFYAARAGSVNSSDLAIMKRTVKKILSKSPGVFLSDRSFRVEIIEPGRKNYHTSDSNDQNKDRTLQVRVHWYYPLHLPFADTFLKSRKIPPVPKNSGINLHASWAMGMSEATLEDKSNARH